MGLFDKLHEPVVIKEDSNAKKSLNNFFLKTVYQTQPVIQQNTKHLIF